MSTLHADTLRRQLRKTERGKSATAQSAAESGVIAQAEGRQARMEGAGGAPLDSGSSLYGTVGSVRTLAKQYGDSEASRLKQEIFELRKQPQTGGGEELPAHLDPWNGRDTGGGAGGRVFPKRPRTPVASVMGAAAVPVGAKTTGGTAYGTQVRADSRARGEVSAMELLGMRGRGRGMSSVIDANGRRLSINQATQRGF